MPISCDLQLSQSKFKMNCISAKKSPTEVGRSNSIRKIPEWVTSPETLEVYSRQHTFRESGGWQLPFLKCFTGSNSRSKNIWISSGWDPARNLITMAMRVPEADFPWVLLPVLFFIRPYKILKCQKNITLFAH